MKKKIFILFVLIFFSLGLYSCTENGKTPSQIDVIYNQVEGVLTELYEEASKSCVGIRTRTDYKDIGTGSGVIYKESNGEYYIVTNHHVVEGGTKFDVGFGKGQFVKAMLLGSDPYIDLAVLRISVISSGINVKPLDITSVEDLIKPGQGVFAIGCPLGLDQFNYLTTGVVAQEADNGDVLHTAPINPGNSGGALFNYSGRLIGINVSKNVDRIDGDDIISIEGMGRAIGMDKVRRTIKAIEKYATLSQPTLGIKGSIVNRYYGSPDVVALLPSAVNQAILVNEVLPGSPADNAGVKVNDVIYTLNGTVIDTIDELSGFIQKFYYSDKFTLVVYRYNNEYKSHELIEMEIELTTFSST